MPDIRLDHVAIGMARIADAPAVLVSVLGGVPESGGPGPGFTFGCWRYAGGGRIEVIEPRGADGFLHRFLGQRGPGIHHVTFKVESLTRACDRAEAHGYRVVGRDESDPRWRVAYLHPKEALGLVVQLAQPGAGGPKAREAPPAPPGVPPPPVTVLGLRTRARSAERARTQWASALGGAGETAGDALVFRWPASPMRIRVVVDPGAEEGPVAIEVASDRALGLPAGPYPGLGAAFAQRPPA